MNKYCNECPLRAFGVHGNSFIFENGVFSIAAVNQLVDLQRRFVMKRFYMLSVLALGVSAIVLVSSAQAGPKIVGSGNASAKGGNGGNAFGFGAKAGNGGDAIALGGNVSSKGLFSSVKNSGNATAIGGKGGNAVGPFAQGGNGGGAFAQGGNITSSGLPLIRARPNTITLMTRMAMRL